MLHFKREKIRVRSGGRQVRGYVPEPLFWQSKVDGGEVNPFFDASVVDIASGKVISGLWTPWVAGGREVNADVGCYTGLSSIDRGLVQQALSLASKERCVILGGRRQSVFLLFDYAEESSTVAAVTLPYTAERIQNAMAFLGEWSCPVYSMFVRKRERRRAVCEEDVVRMLEELVGSMDRMRQNWRARLAESGCPMAYSPQ